MKRSLFLLVGIIVLATVLVACSTGPGADQVVEEYIQALATKDDVRLTVLTCPDWSPAALAEMYSFQAVSLSVQALNCNDVSAEGSITLVTCQGQLITSYNGEEQSLELSTRTYEVIRLQGDYLVCGVR